MPTHQSHHSCAPAADPAGAAVSQVIDRGPVRHDRAAQVERWFTGPVILAAIASVPAVFLTTLGGSAGQVGALRILFLATLIAGAILAVATYVVARARRVTQPATAPDGEPRPPRR